MTTTTVTVTESKPAEKPTEPTQEAQQKKAEQEHRDTASKTLKASRAKAEKAEQKRADDGTFAPAPPVGSAKEPEKAEEKPAPSAEKAVAGSEKPTHDKAKYEEAMKALLLDGTFGPEELATLPPDVVIAKGEKAKKRQKDVDAAYAKGHNALGELETLKAKLAESEKAKGNPAPGTEVASKPTALASSVQALTNKIKEALGDDFDLNGEFSTLTQDIIAASKPDLSATADRKQVEALEAKLDLMVDSAARPKLTKQFEELADDKAWKGIQEKATSLVKAGIVPDREQGLMSAAAMEYGLAAAEKAAQRAKAIDKAKENGQPYSGRQSHEHTTPAKPEDAAKATLRDLRRQYASEGA